VQEKFNFYFNTRNLTNNSDMINSDSRYSRQIKLAFNLRPVQITAGPW